MSENTWNAIAGFLCLMDFLGGGTLVVYGFVQTFISPLNGWLEIFGGVFLLSHAYLIFNSTVEDKDV